MTLDLLAVLEQGKTFLSLSVILLIQDIVSLSSFCPPPINDDVTDSKHVAFFLKQ